VTDADEKQREHFDGDDEEDRQDGADDRDAAEGDAPVAKPLTSLRR